jgi:hypothetical protein
MANKSAQMEKQIRQDFADVWKFLRIFVVLDFVVAAFCALIPYATGQRPELFSMVLGAAIIFVSLLGLLLLVALVLMQIWVKWFISDAGLKRVVRSGEARTIAWEQIYHIGKTRLGYFIRWRDAHRQGSTPIDPEHRGVLHLSEADAAELISLWQQKTALEWREQGRTHFQSASRRACRRLHAQGWGMTALGAVLICLGIFNIARDYSSSSWPSVEGRITSQQYRLIPQQRHRSQVNGQLALSFEYAVADHTYQCSRYSLWHEKYSDVKETADAFAAKHQRGDPVTVYYNPARPEEAVLLRGPEWNGNLAFIVLGLSAIAFGAFMRNVFGKLMRGESVLHDSCDTSTRPRERTQKPG